MLLIKLTRRGSVWEVSYLYPILENLNTWKKAYSNQGEVYRVHRPHEVQRELRTFLSIIFDFLHYFLYIVFLEKLQDFKCHL